MIPLFVYVKLLAYICIVFMTPTNIINNLKNYDYETA